MKSDTDRRGSLEWRKEVGIMAGKDLTDKEIADALNKHWETEH